MNYVPDGWKLVALCHRIHRTTVGHCPNVPLMPDLISSHRFEVCLHGRAEPMVGAKWACINPAHYTMMPNDEGNTRGNCCRAMRISCPHQPSCIWAGPEGQRLRCWDKQEISTCPHGIIMCRCKNQCFNCRKPRSIVRTRVKVELANLEELMASNPTKG